MGVRQAVGVRARAPDELGNVLVTLEFGRNERGLDGFDPAAEIDGLDFALGHPGHARSEYAWNVLLVPNRRLVAGVVERSVLPSFSDREQERVTSAIAAIAVREAWLPGPDGAFRGRPNCPSTTCRRPTRGTRGWPRRWACSSRWWAGGPPARHPGGGAVGAERPPNLVAMVERELADERGDQGER